MDLVRAFLNIDVRWQAVLYFDISHGSFVVVCSFVVYKITKNKRYVCCWGILDDVPFNLLTYILMVKPLAI